jgi:hypothetical protein
MQSFCLSVNVFSSQLSLTDPMIKTAARRAVCEVIILVIISVNVCDGQKCSTEDSSNLSLADLRAKRLAFLDKKPEGDVVAKKSTTADKEPGR